MMTRLISTCAVVLCLASTPPARAQDEFDPKVRLYAQRVHAYLNRKSMEADAEAKKPREVLRQLMTAKAKQLKLPEEKQKELTAAVDRALGLFARELAAEWLKADDSNRIKTDGQSLQTSTLLFETSDSWNTELSKSLDEDTLARWNEDRDKRLADDIKVRDEQLEKARQKKLAAEKRKREREQQRAQMLIVAAERQLPQMMAAGSYRDVLASIERQLQYRKLALQSILEKEIESIAAVVPLTDKQRRRMEVAIKGVVAKDAQSVTSLSQEFNEIEGDLPKERIEELQKLVSIKRIPVQSAFWQKALRSSLGEDSLAAYQRERESAKQFEREAWARSFIVLVHKATPLSAAKRKELLDGLLESPIPEAVFTSRHTSSAAAYAALPGDIQDAVIGEVLTEKQVKKLSTGVPVPAFRGGGFGNPGFPAPAGLGF